MGAALASTRAAQVSPAVRVSPEVVTCSDKTCHPFLAP